LALYAACVWPANWHHALQGIQFSWVPDSWWYHGPRLALQPVLVVAALYAGGWIGADRRKTASEAVPQGQRNST
ncbi:hypothetical protein, partial [Klebsiella pneumoniae]|uniref:hypothetical protein n=1 Tax=Klebsiella pneumoniae TaxID=573 RepID=UPI00226EBBC1